MIRSLNILLLTALFFNSACTYFSEHAQPDKDLLAVVGDKSLYLQDVTGAIPTGLDSASYNLFLKDVVRKWVEDQALLNRAELNLSEEQKDFQKEIEKFRASLITYEYEQEYIRQKLDTVVSESEIEAFYNERPENFQLKDYVLKARFLKIDENAPKLKKIEKWITSSDVEDLLELEEYCIQYTTTFLVEDKWIQLSNLLNVIPLDVIDPKAFLVNTKYKEIYSPPFKYFLFIYDYRLINTLSPLQVEREKIINAIINERRMTLLKNMRGGILSEAMNRNEVQILIK
ncbi:MAG: hypothetical protein CL842_03050 [Crocinitomicaceae bacterium]|nr:hypothetical protein [Crocinitomicaceae bacterium]